MKALLLSCSVLAVILAVFFGFNAYMYNEKQGEGGVSEDYKSVPYFLSGEDIRIGSNGLAYFGNEARGDLDGDGDEDIAFLVTHQPGGSGTFYYLAGAINMGAGYQGTSLMFIGDRIAPQVTEYHSFSGIRGGYIVINYVDRKPTEPFSTQPSVGKSLWAKYSPDTNDFGELVQDFEGESR